MVVRRKNFAGGRNLFQNYFLLLAALVSIDVSAASSRYKHFHRAPIIELSGAEELIGIIREDERVVSVSPQLRIMRETGPICHYELTRLADLKSAKKAHDGAAAAAAAAADSDDNDDDDDDALPFESHILDKTDGTAQIRLRSGAQIDCANSAFAVQLVAVRCADDAARSEPVTLKITVKDTNNHAPEFEAPWYSFDIDDGKIGEIGRLYATDADCGHPYGNICRYEITNTLGASPFRIDDQGVLSTLRPLNASSAESHLLTIVAHDCGMLSSKSTLVTVHVRARCADGLVDAPQSSTTGDKDGGGAAAPKKPRAVLNMESASALLMPDADVVLCPREPTCTVTNAVTEISLSRVPAYANIDAEAAKRCALSPATVELLPLESAAGDASTTSAPTKNALTDDDEESEDEGDEDNRGGAASARNATVVDERKFFFDGKSSAVIVPSSTLRGVIPEKFTLSFAMKHAAGTKQQQALKQNILCESDDFAMNRHHFAVYVRHCKLELLLRREARDAAAEFRAAEWRWEAAEVCDDRWHAYALRFDDLDHVELFVDGRAFGQTDRNPEILDDWPLHETKQHKTRVVVGACWHGRSAAMVQHFSGHLAKMFLWAGGAESPAALRCLHGERARLTFGAIDRLVPGESIVSDKSQSKLTLKATNLKNLSSLLRAVKFEVIEAQSETSRKMSRHFAVTTRVQCAEANRSIPLGTYAARVDVAEASSRSAGGGHSGKPLPQLSIGGQTLITVERRSLKSGTPLMPNIQLVVTQPSQDGSMDTDVTAQHHLDWCKVHLKPSRDLDLEYFSSPAALISFLNVDFEHDKQGIMLKGEESVKNYADVLSKIRYYNTRPDSYSKRIYTVQCSMLGGKVLSNELFVEMDVVDNADLDEAIEKLSGLSKKLDSPVATAAASSSNKDPSSAAIEEQELLKLEKHFEPSFDQLGANRLQNILEMDLPRPKALMGSHHGYEMGQGAVAGGAVAVVVVICIGFLLVLLVIGVLKMRDSPLPSRRPRRSRKATMEGMEWDDNGMGMNITVNPLMDVNKSSQPNSAVESTSIYGSEADEEEDEDSLEDEDESYREEDELTDDDEDEEHNAGDGGGPTLLPHAENSKQRLEWDDSTLAGTATNVGGGIGGADGGRSKSSYCV